MVLDMKVHIEWHKNMDKENSIGLMNLVMKVNSLIIIFMAKGFIHGQMEENMMENGIIIKWTDMVCSLGQIIEDMKDIIKMIRNKEEVPLNGQMVENMKVNG